MASDALTQATVAELAARIRAKDLSPVELAEACLARIEVLPKLNAFITVTREQALAAARKAEAEIAAGQYRGPLHGIPVGLKDLFWTKGVRTTSGSVITKDFIPAEDATVVTRLQEAGAFSIGKTVMVELAYGGTEHNDAYGVPKNPWDVERITGGSSSGSAAAVASGEVPIALGTDTAGSVRAPASLCGLTGLKPTYGLISRFGVTPLSFTQDHVGPLARSAEDVAIAMDAMVGHDPRDPGSVDRPGADYVRALDGGVRGLRIGVLREHEALWGKTHPEVQAAFEGALAEFGELGATVEEVSFPELDLAAAVQMVITTAEAASCYAGMARAHPSLMQPVVRRRILAGLFQPAHAYVLAQRARRLLARRFAEVFARVDCIATPTTPLPAPRLGEATVRTASGEISSREVVRITRLFNPNGLPAISFPNGFSSEGLPMGMQLVARPFNDALVIRAAHAYQQATDWHMRRPAVQV